MRAIAASIPSNGDVTPLLRSDEDHFVIFGSGEHVAIDFDASALPPVAKGWTRDYEIYLNGYVKDMDFHGASRRPSRRCRSVRCLAIPTRRRFPFPTRTASTSWNGITREVADENAASYRFEYKLR